MTVYKKNKILTRGEGEKDQREGEKDQSQGPKSLPHYMAPEVLSGGPHSKESDLWSFGCVLYELFSGEKPFVADSFAELVTKIFHENVPHLRLDMEGAKMGHYMILTM